MEPILLPRSGSSNEHGHELILWTLTVSENSANKVEARNHLHHNQDNRPDVGCFEEHGIKRKKSWTEVKSSDDCIFWCKDALQVCAWSLIECNSNNHGNTRKARIKVEWAWSEEDERQCCQCTEQEDATDEKENWHHSIIWIIEIVRSKLASDFHILLYRCKRFLHLSLNFLSLSFGLTN